VAKKGERQLKLGMLHSGVFKGPNAALQLSDRRDGFGWSLALDANSERFGRVGGIYEENVSPGGTFDFLRTTAIPEEGRMRRLNLTPGLEWTLDGGDKIAWKTFITVGRFRNRAQMSVTTLEGGAPPVPELATQGLGDDEKIRSDLSWTHGFD